MSTTEIDPTHQSPQRMPVRGPALIVVGIAVVILVGGVVASVLSGGGHTVLTRRSVTLPDGTLVRLTPAVVALKPIIGSQPPTDIVGALAVPAGSTERSFANVDQNRTLYDRSVSFSSGLSSDQLISFYQTLLPDLGWQITATAPAANAVAGTVEVLATKGSSDGYYWEVGAVIAPASPSGVSRYTIDLFEQPSQN